MNFWQQHAHDNNALWFEDGRRKYAWSWPEGWLTRRIRELKEAEASHE